MRRAEGCNARGVLQWVAGALAHLLAADHLTPDRCTLGIVGVGHIGSLVERYARHWGFRVLCCDPPRQVREGGDFIPLDELAARADILTFHTPLDDTTRRMVDGRLLSLTRPGAIILNASRGEVVDGRALLASGRRYVLDVWEHEPHIDRSVLDGALYATTHIAGYSAQGKANASAAVIRSLAERFDLPLKEWYPQQVAPVEPQLISWNDMCRTIDSRFDIEAETHRLRAEPEAFERIRSTYDYRQEYF